MGHVFPRMASGLLPMMNLQLRAVEIADLDVRLKKLEDYAARDEKRRR